VTPNARKAALTKRTRMPNAVEWLAAATLAALLGVGAGTILRADEPSSATLDAIDQALVRALGAPTGVLVVVNPANCALSARDAVALNSVAAIPGVRVSVLLLAIPQHDSAIQAVRRDFGFSAAVALAPASSVDAKRFPTLLRMPFVALITRGQLRHAAWGEAIKSLDTWLPALVGAPATNPPPSSS